MSKSLSNRGLNLWEDVRMLLLIAINMYESQGTDHRQCFLLTQDGWQGQSPRWGAKVNDLFRAGIGELVMFMQGFSLPKVNSLWVTWFTDQREVLRWSGRPQDRPVLPVFAKYRVVYVVIRTKSEKSWNLVIQWYFIARPSQNYSLLFIHRLENFCIA